jgi:HEAT repeat protein
MRLFVALGALVGVVLAAAHAEAAPPAGLPATPPGAVVVKVDLDGDGAPDTCTLLPGRLTVAFTAGAPAFEHKLAAGRPGAARLKAHQVRPAGADAPLPVVEARVPLARPAGAEEVVVLAGSPFRVVFAGRVGPMGRDGEWSQHVTVSAEGVLRFERAVSAARCDGAPTHLNAEVWDFKAGRFRPQPQAFPVPTQRVTAQRQPPRGAPTRRPLSPFFVSGASSVLGAGGSAGGLTPPVGLTDGKLETAWITDDPFGGHGQFVTVRGTPDPYLVKALRIVPGHGRGAREYAYFSRLHRANLIFDRGSPVRVEFPAELAGAGGSGVAYWVVLPEPVAATCITMLVESTFPGRPKAGDKARTAVAEVTVYTEADFGADLAQILGRLVARLASGSGGDAVKRLVVQQGAAAEPLLIAALPTATATGRPNVVEALAAVPTPAAAEALGRALDAGEREHRAASAALLRLGAAAVPALAAILADQGAPRLLRARAAAVLGKIGGEAAVRALLGALPAAPDNLRDAVAGALRERPLPAALPLVLEQLASAGDARLRADLLRAVAITAAAANPEARAKAVAAVTASAPQVRDFEERFRLAQACGALRDASLAPLLDALVGASEPELREAAAAAASELPAAAATALLRRALADASPEVRRAAAAGLARRRDVPLEAEVAALLGKERWPQVRREVATALAERCTGEATRAVLRTAVGDADREVARTSLRALVACHDPQVGKLLLSVVGNAKRPALLRETAAGGLGTLGDRSLVPEVARLFDEIRTEPGTDDRGESLTVTLAHSLGRLGDERALRALRQASVDPASARVRAAAVEAIADICPVGAAKVLAEAEKDKDLRVVGAARAARARCKR